MYDKHMQFCVYSYTEHGQTSSYQVTLANHANLQIIGINLFRGENADYKHSKRQKRGVLFFIPKGPDEPEISCSTTILKMQTALSSI